MIGAHSEPSGATPAAEHACPKLRGSTPPEPGPAGQGPLRGQRAEIQNGRGSQSLGKTPSATLASPKAGHLGNASLLDRTMVYLQECFTSN
jgi:hypothetical protein